MKGITFILSILMLTLSLKPCSDSFNEEHNDDIAMEQNHDHSKDADDSCPNDTDDSCPSICICSCCGIAITFEALNRFEIQPNIEISTKISNTYSSKYTFDYLSNIWQPPQIIS